MLLLILAILIIIIGLGFGVLLIAFIPASQVGPLAYFGVILVICFGAALLIWEFPNSRLNRRVKQLKDYSFWLENSYDNKRFDFEAFLYYLNARAVAISEAHHGYLSCRFGATKFILASYWADELSEDLKAEMTEALADNPDATTAPADVYLVTIYDQIKKGQAKNRQFFPSQGKIVHDGYHPKICFTWEGFAAWHNDTAMMSRQK